MTELHSKLAHSNMIKQQIRPWNVSNEDVLNVMLQLPRAAFVPAAYQALAFADISIPLGMGQIMMPPKLEAHLLQALAIRPGDRVLEIGTGSGYLTACLAWLSGNVISIEIFPELAECAASTLTDQDISAELITGDAFDQEFEGEFDAIAVTGGLPVATDHFMRLLSPEGRLFQVVGVGPTSSAELVTRNQNDGFTHTPLFETELTPLLNATIPKTFVF